ncbi:FAD-binding oxidoreductase [Streptomyces sp. NPDC053741]|uniref:FAD-dependent oxidoreductase n=1 Tax=Streptomyces TaxID=1883 RepID=UPI0004BE3862|nr:MULTISPECIES: FAD-binding oxidoreductase [Streptomyces]MDX2618308.1 FAD-binding oxidoreductase [Streptomyces sp. WI03-5b]MDX3186596.1 FAD-binding oxidoreductase [Streptomyces sp. ME02-7008A-1]MDX3307293.1 FAD-binding oxidoreductase [Streptomyces sp. ME02-7008A]MEE1778943.1 FAD-binding oxidoreductase [Streptomyces sp. JV181]MYT55600.1 FAD-binding protein [Streptomyces sp. SID7834]
MQTPTDTHDAVSAALLAELCSHVPADRVLTDGPEYARAVALFNAAVDVRPSVVVRCSTSADVQAGVRASRNHGVPLSVRGGGHDFWGRAFRPGGVALDLTGMRDVQIDVNHRCATVGGGALSSDVVSAAERVGLSAVTGTAGSVGMVGLTLGGGYGPLLGQFGLAADNLLGAEVVLADGSQVTTDAEHHPDLFWALRGGGGNFGVVTSARIRLHPVPTVVSGTILYPIDQSAGILADLGGILQSSPDELTVDVGFLPGPDGKPAVYVAPTWSGDLEIGNAENGPVHSLARLGTPVFAEVGPVARSTTLDATDAMFPPGRMGAIRTRTVQSVTGPLATVLDRAAQQFTSPFSAIVWHQFHGAATRPALGSTAFGRREPHLMVELISMWENSENREHTGGGDGGSSHLRWLEDTHTALEPFSLPGGYVNFLGPETPDQVAGSYGANTERLLAIKSAVDPDSVFSATPLPTDTSYPGSSPV